MEKRKVLTQVPVQEWIEKHKATNQKILCNVIRSCGDTGTANFLPSHFFRDNKAKFLGTDITHVLEDPGKEVYIIDELPDSEIQLEKLARQMNLDFTKPSDIALGWRKCYEWMTELLTKKL